MSTTEDNTKKIVKYLASKPDKTASRVELLNATELSLTEFYEAKNWLVDNNFWCKNVTMPTKAQGLKLDVKEIAYQAEKAQEKANFLQSLL